MIRALAFSLALAGGAQGATSSTAFSPDWTLKAPPFRMPATLAEWATRREDVRRSIVELLGDQPRRPVPPDGAVVKREDRGDYVVETFRFDNGAGDRVPGYLLLPKAGKPPYPALVYLHYHGGEYALGKEVLFRDWPGEEKLGEELVRCGYAVMCIDAYCFGARRGRGPGGHVETDATEEMSTSKYFLWKGTSLFAMMVRDDLVSIDYLLSRPEIDRSRVGAFGMSMGSTRAWWLAALDDRIAAVVAVACLTRYEDLARARAYGAHGIYFFMPGFMKRFDTEAVLSLIAPRPFLTLTGNKDDGSPVSGVAALNESTASVYRLFRKPAAFRGVVYSGVGHEYTTEMWRETIEWFDRHLATKTP